MTEAINVVFIHYTVTVRVRRYRFRKGIKRIIRPSSAVDGLIVHTYAMCFTKCTVEKRACGIGERLEIERADRKVMLTVDL